MTEHTSKMVATVGIWGALACIFIFGAFRINWEGGVELVLVVLILALAACASTIAIWVRGKPSAAQRGFEVLPRIGQE